MKKQKMNGLRKIWCILFAFISVFFNTCHMQAISAEDLKCNKELFLRVLGYIFREYKECSENSRRLFSSQKNDLMSKRFEFVLRVFIAHLILSNSPYSSVQDNAQKFNDSIYLDAANDPEWAYHRLSADHISLLFSRDRGI